MSQIQNSPDIPIETTTFEPIRMLEVELSEPLPDISKYSASGVVYTQAYILVRLFTQPLGLIKIVLSEDCLRAESLAHQIWQVLHFEINVCLRHNGLPEIASLDTDGIVKEMAPSNLQERELFLHHAPFVSIIIPTHERPESLIVTLEDLVALDYPHYEVMIVDNAPKTQATAEVVQRFVDSGRVRYVREDLPGCDWARNRGLEEIRSEIVAFTDDDVRVDRHWLTEIVRAFECGYNVACVTGLTLPAELEAPSQLWFEQYGGFNKGFARRIYDLEQHKPNDQLFPYTAGKFGSSANMAMKTSVLRQLSGFDPALGAGSLALAGGDIALYFRVITRGYQLVYEPNAIIHHFHRREYATLRRQIYNYGVGLTAFFTKTILEEPHRFVELAKKLPSGLLYALNPRSPKNAKKRGNYPQELTKLELWGMLYGPLAYLRSRQNVRKQMQQRDNQQPYTITSATEKT
ncbi:MAG: glycosyltransferase [Chloroflexi bacterium AL-N10]|nr:glycosyltransferase [Chloroflexi bacterium AL-N10]